MPSFSFGNPFASDVSVHSVTRLLRRTRDIACSVQKRLAIADLAPNHSQVPCSEFRVI